MEKLGSKQRPIILKVRTQERAARVSQICDENGWHFIMGLEPIEDITDLKRAFKDKQTQTDVYAPCLCGSGKKYKFCCAKKPIELSL